MTSDHGREPGWSRYLLAAGFPAVMLVHLVWSLLHTAVPPWDMAHHQLEGWQVLEAWRQGRLLADFPALSDYYPPLYYLIEALFVSWAPGGLVPLLSNVLGCWMLAFFTYRIAGRFLDPAGARLAGLLTLMFPLVAWTSRLSLLDVALCGWVAAATWALVKSDFLERGGWSIRFGMAVAAGLLTKWTFALFLALPVVWALAASRDRRRSLLHLVDASLVASPLVFWWYLPNLSSLQMRFDLTAAAALAEGDPSAASLAGLLYYPRALSSYYLHLPLTLLLAAAAATALRHRRGPATAFLWCWLLGSLGLLTLLQAKDPRYVMPAVVPVAVLLVRPLSGRPLAVAGLAAFAFAQLFLISFHTPLGAVKVALFEVERDTDYRSMRQEWVWFQTGYFGVAGPPRQSDWPHEAMLDRIGDGRRVAFIPDSAGANPTAFQLAAVRRGQPLEVLRLGDRPGSEQRLSEFAFAVGKTGEQGISYITRHNRDVYRRLEELNWPLIQKWELPDQSHALLWRNPIPSP